MKITRLFSFFFICAITTMAAPFQFSNMTPDRATFTWNGDTMVITPINEHQWQGAIGFDIKDIKPNTSYEFSCDVELDFKKSVFMQIKCHKDGKEVQRISGTGNKHLKDRIRVDINSQSFASIQPQIRFNCDKYSIGHKITASNFYFGPSRPIDNSSLPRFEVIPGFNAISFYINKCISDNPEDFKITAAFRPTGQQNWQEALPPTYSYIDKSARGSFLKLQENTEYEYRIHISDMGKTEILTGKTTTRNSIFPIAKTIVLDRHNCPGPLQNIQSGTEDGYIRYVGTPGFVLNGGNTKDCAIDLSQKHHVILENLVIRGGRKHGINASHAHDIIIRNCDIAGFARIGTQRCDIDGKYYEGKMFLNNDCGIRIISSDRVLVERTIIHSPRSTANSWFYSHPAGPNGLFIGESSSLVLRYNDIIGNTGNRWNDAIEGKGNGMTDGGPMADAEIYGNYLAFGNDDGIELDGGQANCRFAYNKTESMLCGISTAPCLLGPSYIWQNLFCNGGDEFCYRSSGVKNGFVLCGFGTIFAINNIVIDYNDGFGGFGKDPQERRRMTHPVFKLFARNNLVRTKGQLYSLGIFNKPLYASVDFDLFAPAGTSDGKIPQLQRLNQAQNVISATPAFINEAACDYRLQENTPGYGDGTRVPNLFPGKPVSRGAFQPGGFTELPYRPAPFSLGGVSFIELKVTSATPESRKITVTPQPGFTGKFRIVKPFNAKCFKVEPESGTFANGKAVELTISTIPSAVTKAQRFVTAFSIRLEDGLSRPVSVAVDSRKHPQLLKEARTGAIYGTVTKTDNASILTVNIPEDGDYWLFLREKAAGSSANINTSIDGGKTVRRMIIHPVNSKYPWVILAARTFNGENNTPLKFTKGTHSIEISPAKGFDFSDFAVTKDPDTFRLAPEEL